jgi:hypothetical protein
LHLKYYYCSTQYPWRHSLLLWKLQPNGFAPVTVPFPPTPAERLIEMTQSWANEFNRREEGFDATNITANTITITANKENAFFYRNRGEAFDHEIRYEMQLTFNEDSYNLNFVIIEIYSRDRLLESDISDFFTSEGRLKEGYDELERSLETTVNNIVRSHYNYMNNFR